jgi:putative endonuclease
MYYVYVIRSEESRHYIGYTKDIEKRIAQHNSKSYKGWTKRFHNWELIYSESYETRLEAIKREREIKKMRGGSSFKKLIEPHN